ncbi:uncharacterized protein LOC105304491 isoform X2 [Pteropus vampyrus]|uniref:Uncharacterized protein LOC105304491 isoform X2 n=1 Tax=Pteropus vampyrus TaxID=132908 RepID=A0A6P6BSU0_PTEVA|nr:uncharacterized protein LOC105304491 isoform X2 [Pteropus vampyrus]
MTGCCSDPTRRCLEKTKNDRASTDGPVLARPPGEREVASLCRTGGARGHAGRPQNGARSAEEPAEQAVRPLRWKMESEGHSGHPPPPEWAVPGLRSSPAPSGGSGLWGQVTVNGDRATLTRTRCELQRGVSRTHAEVPRLPPQCRQHPEELSPPEQWGRGLPADPWPFERLAGPHRTP